ncbi:MAG: hypothetical protein GF346_04310, partial [Candidatus Eisenbacteria bacterium]|nr:hypothetical protein [Candidatus Latescibacterota bacterium]MBD3301650.1 hypothetical protein [Candidatus Eisenbacteria bacterium]
MPGTEVLRVALSAGATTIAPGDSTTIRATVTEPDGATPAAGRTVLFSEMLNKHSGTYAKTSAVTDSDGVATNVFRADAGVTGRATLKASVDGQAAYAEVLVSAAPPSDLVLEIASLTGATAIPADGESGLRLEVTARRDGAPAGDLAITLRVDPLGTLSDSTVTTRSNGTAEFELTASDQPGTTTITASAEGVQAQLPIQFHPTSLQVTIQPAVAELIADGISTTDVTVTVTDASQSPMNGVIVRMVAGEAFDDVDGDGEFTPGVDPYIDANDNGSWDAIGQIDSYGTTQENGKVYATYTAGLEAREVWIHALVSGGGAKRTIQLVPVPRAHAIEISAAATSLYANDFATVDGEVVVRDRNGAPLAGKTVTLVAGEPFDDVDADGLFTPGVDELLDDVDGNGEWSAIGSVEETTVTRAGGVGAFTYRAGLHVGTIAIKATVDGVGVDLPLELTSLPPASRVEMTVDPVEITVFGGGGVDNAEITAECFDILDQLVPAGVPVRFEIVQGPGGGEQLADAADGVYTGVTGDDGSANAVLVAGTAPGIVEISATAGSVYRTIQIGIVSGIPHMVELSAEDHILTFWAETRVCAHVYDVNHNPVRDGTVVRFSVDEGRINGDDGEGTSTIRDGQACATYYSLGPAIGTDFIAEIEAEVLGTTKQGHLEIQLEETPPPPINEVALSADRTRVPVRRTDPPETVNLVARGYTVDGQPVGAGYPIRFWIESGPQGGENLDGMALGSDLVAHTNQDGIAQTTLEPGTLPGPVQVRAHSGTANIVGVEIQIVAGAPVAIECSAEPEQIDWEETSEIRAYLYDEFHNPVEDGVLVSFSANKGLVSGFDGPSSSRTENGVAKATYTSLPSDPDEDGVATITCTAAGGDLVCQVNVRIPVQDAGLKTLSLTPADRTLMVTGGGETEETTVAVVAYNQGGQPVGEGYDVRFEVVSGPGGGETLDGVVGGPTVASTDGQGRAAVTLRAGRNAGELRIKARYGQIESNEERIAIEPGPAVEINCYPGRYEVADDDSTTVFVRVRDLHRNPVLDSTMVTFAVDEGWIDGTAYEGAAYSVTIGGLATGLYHSPEESPGGDGFADITCTVEN